MKIVSPLLLITFFAFTASLQLTAQKNEAQFLGTNCVGANGGTILPDSISICDGFITTLSSSGVATGTGISNQWMVSSTTGGPYSNVVGGSGELTDTYTTAPLSAGIYYFILQNTCSFGPFTSNSNEVMVVVNSFPSIFANSSAFSVCQGSPVTLTGSGGTSYSWSGGVIDGVPFIPTTTDTYTVIGTDSTGCQTMDLITIGVNPYPTVTLNFPVDTVCLNGGLFSLSGESPVGGTWLGTGVSGNTFDPMASGTGYNLITYTYADNIGCSSSDTASLFVEVCNGIDQTNLGIAFTISPNPSNGNFLLEFPSQDRNVMLTVSNALGQVIYSQNFESGTNTLQHLIQLTDCEKGIYIVTISTKESRAVEKLVIR